MYKQVPNLITISRLVLTVIFFFLLNVHDDVTFYRNMWAAFVVFVLAVATDWLDGYLARRWKAESAFGRVVDPFVDKIMICGAFVFFASHGFINVAAAQAALKEASTSQTALTGVWPWMTVVLIGREFLITGIRGFAESRGIDFRADWAGKIKMIVQCIAGGAIIFHIATAWQFQWVRLVRDISIWATLAATILSAIGYIVRARKLFYEK